MKRFLGRFCSFITLCFRINKMSDIAFSFGYSGTKEDAINQVKKIEQMAHQKFPQYDGCWEITWQDKGGSVDARYMGVDISGQFDIVERDSSGGDVKVTVKLPMLLSMMKDSIETKLKSEIQKMIG